MAARLQEARDLLLVDHGNPRPTPAALSLTQQLDLPAHTPICTGQIGAPGDSADLGQTNLGLGPAQVLADRYELRERLGSGGMGQVFAAFDRVRNEEVALKVLLPHLLADPEARGRFLNKARIASNITHPSIVRVYDIHQTERLTFLTMERLKGRSLRTEILLRAEKAERFGVAEVIGFAKPLCDALQPCSRLYGAPGRQAGEHLDG